MKAHTSVEALLWFGAVGALALAVIGWRGAEAQAEVPPSVAIASAQVHSWPGVDTLRKAARLTTDRNPFRVDRRPATVAFDAQLEGAPPPPPPMPRPPIVLVGILGGPPWQAVLDGIPGRSGSVVARAGESFGDLHVRAVRRDTVIVQGADTTWRLTIRRAWQ